MYENKIIDQPGDFLRDPLDMASRWELYQFAQANHVKEIDEAMYMGAYAGMKMKKILRARGLTNIKPKSNMFEKQPEQEVKTVTLDDIANEPTPTINAGVMSRAELAKECKRRGIKMQRTDTKEKLQERLSVPHAA